MKKLKFNIYKILTLLVGVLFLFSCSEDILYPQNRLFQPVLNKDLSTNLNTITVNMAALKNAVYYKVEVSRDTFKTVVKSIDSPLNLLTIDKLLWNTLYQVRATAISASPEFNSHISSLGAIQTETFPSILQPPSKADLLDTKVKMNWLINGADVTVIKVYAKTDDYLEKPLASYETSPAEKLSGVKIISDLTPDTTYQLAIYSGDVIRGWLMYTTKPAILIDASTIDLRQNPDASLLIATITAAAPGSTILLNGDLTYAGGNYNFDKSITIKSGYSFNPSGAIINQTGAFGFAAGSSGTSINFSGVTLLGNGAGYLFNQTVAANVDLIKFDNCRIDNERGIFRIRSTATGTLKNYVFNNCVVSNILDYACIVSESTTYTFLNVLITNSTFYKIRRFLKTASTTNMESITMNDCTFSETAGVGANYFFDFPITVNVTNGVNFKNVILGRAWDFAAANAGFASTFHRTGAFTTTNLTYINTYLTADAAFVALTPIPSVNYTYSKTIESLWVNPAAGNFLFKDTAFAGRKTCGDPRWRSIN